jgi:tRNA pseudouridine13 synthase
MLIKLVPEDFVVEELADWTPSARGRVSVYEVTKRKLDTFEAVRLISAHTGVPLDRIAYIGLKDRQGVTTQLVSLDGGRLDGRISGLRWRYLGRSSAPLSPANLRGNAFTLVVRDLGDDDLALLQDRRARLLRHGLVNYFDDQRFGSLVAGQGLPGRDLVRGDHEAVVRALIATPGKRDPLPEKKWKRLVTKAWGDWELIARKWGARKGKAMVVHLRRRPGDFTGALQRLPAKERAIHVFAYQSLVWNRSVGLYLERALRRVVRTRYVGGELVWPDAPAGEELPPLVETFPLLDHTVEPTDPLVRAAVDDALREEGLTRATFKIEGIPGCFFKHHERPLRVWPEALTIGAPEPDDRRPGRLKVRLSFRLPAGAYATLVLLRLFGAQARDAERRRPLERPPGEPAGDDEEREGGSEDAPPAKAERHPGKRRARPGQERRGGRGKRGGRAG